MRSGDIGEPASSRGGSGAPITPYDEFRYPGHFYPQASPDHMAVLAVLYGLDPAPVERSRILELGCGEGGHLRPLAYALPESQFLGVDLSQAAIARAQALAERAELKNAEFRSQNLTDFPEAAGRFDYIIAHGVYSWIPEPEQHALLEICRRHLAPEGVAYISYDTYPGGHLRQILRDLAVFHTSAISESGAMVREAHKVSEFILSAMPARSLERELLRKLLQRYKESDALTRFDLLAEDHEPSYFLDFMERAGAHGLQYLGESDVKSMQTAPLPKHTREWLDAIPNRLVREQYLDFIHCRGFRQTILCLAGRKIELDAAARTMERLMVSGSLRPAQPLGDLDGGQKVEFRTARGLAVNCTEAMHKAVYDELGAAYPRALLYGELRSRVCRRLGWDEPLDGAAEAKLIHALMSSQANDVVEFHTYRPPFATEVGERPIASKSARIQIEKSDTVSSMRFASIAVDDPVMRMILPLLDGTRDLRQLQIDLQNPNAPGGAHFVETALIDKALKSLAGHGLLVG